jgi:hypothetical protein
MNELVVIFEEEIEGRRLVLSKYSTGELKVETTQNSTDSTEFSSDGTSHVFPVVIEQGDPIEFDVSVDQLENELQEVGFSAQIAQEIASRLG